MNAEDAENAENGVNQANGNGFEREIRCVSAMAAPMAVN